MIPNSKIMIVQRAQRNVGTMIPEDAHNWHEFVYYVSCEGTLTMNGREYEIKPGRFATIRPNTLHSEVHRANGIVFFCIFQCEAELDDMVFDDDAEHSILHLCESLYLESRRHLLYSEELGELILSELLLRVMRWRAEREDRERDLTWAAQVIEGSFGERLNLRKIAADIGYGYDYFHHRFREIYGCSPKQYQMHCRIRKAKELLETGRYSCTEIAYLAGFSDSAQFSKLFNKYAGKSPTAWRQSVEK